MVAYDISGCIDHQHTEIDFWKCYLDKPTISNIQNVRKNNSSVAGFLDDSQIFMEIGRPFFHLTENVKLANVQNVDRILNALNSLENAKAIEGYKEILKKGVICYMGRNETFGTLWWLTFQSSGEAVRIEAVGIQKLKKRETDNLLNIMEYIKQKTSIFNVNRYFNDCRQVYACLRYYIGFTDSGLYGGKNMPGIGNILEKDCVNYCLSYKYIESQLQKGVQYKRLVGIANTLEFARGKYKDIFHGACAGFRRTTLYTSDFSIFSYPFYNDPIQEWKSIPSLEESVSCTAPPPSSGAGETGPPK